MKFFWNITFKPLLVINLLFSFFKKVNFLQIARKITNWACHWPRLSMRGGSQWKIGKIINVIILESITFSHVLIQCLHSTRKHSKLMKVIYLVLLDFFHFTPEIIYTELFLLLVLSLTILFDCLGFFCLVFFLAWVRGKRLKPPQQEVLLNFEILDKAFWFQFKLLKKHSP